MKYAVHPGWITSKNDAEWHYIGVAQLVRLYELRHNEYIVWDEKDPRTYAGRIYEEYVHLYPNYHGLYGRPDAKKKP